MSKAEPTVSQTIVSSSQEDLFRPQGHIDVSSHFDAANHFSWARWLSYRNPGPHARDVENGSFSSSSYRHRDILNRVTYRPKDVLRYISPTYGKPLRAVVQVTHDASARPAGDWRRVKVAGNAPWILRLSSWALKEVIEERSGALGPEDFAMVALKVIVAAPLQLLLISFPIGSQGDAKMLVYYKNFPAKSWAYPKYARNHLDAKPNAQTEVTWESNRYDTAGEYTRQLRPRKLVVRRGNQWVVEEPESQMPYVFVSYTRAHFDPDTPRSCQPLYQIAEQMTNDAGLNAYWLDHRCIIQKKGAEQTDDIHRICDIIRGAHQVCVAVPALEQAVVNEWGRRMWTLSEALLADNKHHIKFCAINNTSILKSKIDLADEVWGNDHAGRLLAEHFSGNLTLSRLELISLGLEALSMRETKTHFTNGDMAYALMGLLGRRPKANPQDNQFQALARLSLANDSDKIVERMICMLPDLDHFDGRPPPGWNNKFVLKDKLGANLWDIEPLCQVAGVCEGTSLILDGCRGASIRWKDIPAIAYLKRSSWKRFFVSMMLRSGAIWMLIGLFLLAILPTKGTAAVFLLLGAVLIFTSPWTVIMLYGGKVWGAAPWLIGFEGYMRLSKIEKLTFGNSIGRLSYAPSSSLLSWKDENERIGKSPDWIEGRGEMPYVPPGHRIFTLIDTGTMTVSVFTAEKPPSVALIAGREGGMLRTVLCHYERSTATLHKQTVLRMETPMIDRTELLGWVKIE